MCIVCASGASSAANISAAPGAAAPPTFNLEQIIAQLDRDFRGWAGGEVTFTFLTALPFASRGDSNYLGFSAFRADQEQAVRDIFVLLTDVADLNFTEAADNFQTDNRLTFANSSTMPDYVWGWAAGGYYDLPEGERDQLAVEEVWVRTDQGEGSYALGTYNFMALMHEIMHGLGVPHPGDYNASEDEDIIYATHAEYAQDSRQYTIMSYFGASATGAQHDVFAAAPLLHDIAILQHIYGANMSTRTGDTVYGFNSTAGRAAFDFNLTSKPVIAIWDAAGVDTIDLSGYASDSILDLREGGFSSFAGMTQNMAIAYGAVVENAIGGSGGDTIYGNAAGNVIDGRGGADVMQGFGGDDTYFVDAREDQVIEANSDGYDEVLAGVNYTLDGTYIERLTLTGGTAVYAIGNSLNNALVGNGADNVLDGGAGADKMRGGLGDDEYHVDHRSDRIYEYNGEGNDAVVSSVSFNMGGQYVERLTLTGSADLTAVGNSLNNVLIGNNGDNVLSGGTGHDVFHIQNAGDRVLEKRGQGTDHVYSSVNFDLAGQYIERLTLTEGGGSDAFGNSLSNQLFGNSGDNRLAGYGGQDLIDGGAGQDRLRGGELSDRFDFNALSDSTVARSDIIVDLEADDRIDLSDIDANEGVAGDQAFALVDAFTGAAGQIMLTYDLGSRVTSVWLDTDGDGQADGLIRLDGDHRDFDTFLF